MTTQAGDAQHLHHLRPYTPPPSVIAAFDYVDALHRFMIAVVRGDVDGIQAATAATEDAARRMAIPDAAAPADAR